MTTIPRPRPTLSFPHLEPASPVITHLAVHNFKSFRDAKVDLNRFNVILGANAAGKSNLVQLFRFLHDITDSGLDNAISMQGGVEYLRNLKLTNSEDLSLAVHYNMSAILRRRASHFQINLRDIDYTFSLRFHKRGSGFSVVDDKLTMYVTLLQAPALPVARGQDISSVNGTITLARVSGKLKFSQDFPGGMSITSSDIVPPFVLDDFYGPRNILLEHLYYILPPTQQLGDIAIYDFDPKLPKRAVPMSGMVELEGDASNLALVLKTILSTSDHKRRLSNLISDVLPFVRRIDTANQADKSLLFKLRESYSGARFLPASLLSDGTINVAALIVALYFEDHAVTVIEEPERNIHPHLITKVMEMMKDVASRKQIIITTHNTEIVKHAALTDLLLVSRDSDGYSAVCRPADSEAVRAFLTNEVGIDELYVQNLLGD